MSWDPNNRALSSGVLAIADLRIAQSLTVDSETDLTVEFQYEQCAHSHTELKRRHVRVGNRHIMGQELQKQLPRAMYLKNLTEMKDDIMESGCRDEGPTPNVLKNSNEIISL